MSTASPIQPFNPSIPQSEVDRLKRKLQDTRLPPKPIVPDAGDAYGPSYDWGKRLYDAWTNDFDWSSHEKNILSAPHFTYTHNPDYTHTPSDKDGQGLKIHFVHAESPRQDAIPLLMVHGWPGSFYEFNRVWGPLSNPEGEGEQAFHVVVPSLPGFAWSDWPPRKAWTLQDTARVFDGLMRALGYKQ